MQKRTGTRQLHMENGVYQYRNGKGATVIYDPSGRRSYVQHHIILGTTPACLERMVWKNRGYSVKPSHIRDFIRKRG